MGTGRLEPPGLDVDPRAWGVLGAMPLRGRMWLPDSASRLRSPWPGEAATSAEAPVTIVGQTPRPADRQLLGPSRVAVQAAGLPDSRGSRSPCRWLGQRTGQPHVEQSCSRRSDGLAPGQAGLRGQSCCSGKG